MWSTIALDHERENDFQRIVLNGVKGAINQLYARSGRPQRGLICRATRREANTSHSLLESCDFLETGPAGVAKSIVTLSFVSPFAAQVRYKDGAATSITKHESGISLFCVRHNGQSTLLDNSQEGFDEQFEARILGTFAR